MEIIPFDSKIARDAFDCGEPVLNHYLQQLAGQHSRKNVSRTFLATANNTVAGFYSLSMAEAQAEELPTSTRKKLPPQYPVPVARLSRLAVDKGFQGQRIGEFLLVDALLRCARIADEMGSVGVIVDAKHEQTQQFYIKYGFSPFASKPLTLFIAMQTVTRSLATDTPS